MKVFVRALAAFIATAVAAAGAGDGRLVHSLVVPATAVQAGAAFEFQLATLNRSAESRSLPPARARSAALVLAGERIPLALQHRDSAQAAGQTLPAGSFALGEYSTTIPADSPIGLAAIEIQLDGEEMVRGAIEILAAATGGGRRSSAAPVRPVTNLVRAEPAVRAVRRIFAERIAPHEATYFIYGADDPVAKFQFSFKYKILDFRQLGPQRMMRSLQFAFTQRSLWDLNRTSSPFYDTSYMPELLYQSLTPMPEKVDGNFTWLGYQAAFKHESNGRDGPQTRSLNVVYARPVFALGRLDHWHLLVVPEIFGYLGDVGDNPDIENYRGYGKLHLMLGRNEGPSLSAEIWAGKDFDRVSTEFNFTFPVRTQLLNFETYFLVQYFNGYGESLLSYRTHSETVRAGFSLVR